jgi:molybdopterin molybdotransferase
MIPVDEALERVLRDIPDLGFETVPLAQAHNRVLAAPLIARTSHPPFDASAMDGYAVRTDDVVPGHPLRIAGAAQAGQRFVGMMERGQCVRIFTGAPLPIGADAVIMQERATVEGALVTFDATPRIGQSVRRQGMDFRDGKELLPSGVLMTPAAVGLAASANVPEANVVRRPRVVLLSTGDELREPGSALGTDEIVASNTFSLTPLVEPLAAQVYDLGIVRDDPRALDEALLRALDDKVDVIVTTGGASVGERDYVREVLIDLGVNLEFWKIRMRPGKPLMFGRRGKTLVFGLPGNPVSAFVTSQLFVLPALRALGQRPQLQAPVFLVPLTAPIPPNGERRHYMRAKLAVNDSSILEVTPILETDSAHASSLAEANALIIQPEGDPGQSAMTLVRVMPLDWA